MEQFFTNLFTLVAIVVPLIVTLFFKWELERMFREKKQIIAFHICNIVIILMVAFAARTVMTVYVFEGEFKIILPVLILFLIVMPMYVGGHYVFQHYKLIYRKYSVTENGKVLVINEKYLRRR